MSTSENAARTGLRAGATAVVHESYSFACMRCGSGWEQSFEIEHHKAGDGHEFVLYVADGRVVPSPLTRPTCANCDNHVVRIMRPGRVASIRGTGAGQRHRVPPAGPLEVPVVPDAVPAPSVERRHWHLADLLHALHLHRRAS
ncbi:hypothetical protein GCM10022384_37330 [Streptomyces marokkonensis]|uniref:C2H2-type domain-containing protein n=1 Tax=Streptomyces marokkonensis TaxID=324855 RepID=A0ABP7QNL2_9ACTN